MAFGALLGWALSSWREFLCLRSEGASFREFGRDIRLASLWESYGDAWFLSVVCRATGQVAAADCQSSNYGMGW